MTLWRWWSGGPKLRTPPGRPGPRSSSRRPRQSLMKLPSGLFGRLPEISASHTQLWTHVWRRIRSVGSTDAKKGQILTEKTKNPRQIKSVRLLTWTRWTTSFSHTSRTSPTWPPTTPKPVAIRRVFAELPPAFVEKACSQFRIRIKVVTEAESGYIE